MTEELVYESLGSDVQTFVYYCKNCKKRYKCHELENHLTHFLNQITVVLSIGEVILNIMLFKNSFKIAGCKEDNDAVEATMILWEDHIRPILGASKTPGGEAPKFVFNLVMRNVDFRLGFSIDRKQLNLLMNNKRYKDKIDMSQCETTSHTNVNIKMHSEKPKGFTYDCLVIPDPPKEPFWLKMANNPYESGKPKRKKFITFIVFSSSEVILSGRYPENMKAMYEFFVTEAYKNRDLIEEKIEPPKMDLLTHLRNSGHTKIES